MRAEQDFTSIYMSRRRARTYEFQSKVAFSKPYVVTVNFHRHFFEGDNSNINLDPQLLDDDDLSKILVDQSRDALCNSSKKKEVLLSIYEKKDDILKTYDDLDKLALGIDLKTKMQF